MRGLVQPQWSGDCQGVAEAVHDKFADCRNSRSVLNGREPCRGLASPRGRALKSRIFAGQKLS